MDYYRFACGAAEYHVALSKYDSELPADLQPFVFPPWRQDVFASPGHGYVARAPRDCALDDARLLLGILVNDEPLLRYSYCVKVTSLAGAGAKAAVGRRFPCTVDGVSVAAVAGRGVCAVRKRSYLHTNADVVAALVMSGKMRP